MTPTNPALRTVAEVFFIAQKEALTKAFTAVDMADKAGALADELAELTPQQRLCVAVFYLMQELRVTRGQLNEALRVMR